MKYLIASLIALLILSCSASPKEGERKSVKMRITHIDGEMFM
jgi:hypothetical protein